MARYADHAHPGCWRNIAWKDAFFEVSVSNSVAATLRSMAESHRTETTGSLGSMVPVGVKETRNTWKVLETPGKCRRPGKNCLGYIAY